MLIHPRSIYDKVFEVWRSPGRFTKNPDIICLPSGRLMLVYSDNDAHWSLETQVLTLLASDDMGKTWYKFNEVDSADLRNGDERLVTPRLSRLDDGRLVVLVDHDDFGHFHEDQPSGNWAYWSEDEGKTWSGKQVTGIIGFEPDRVMELPDGRLAVISHLMLRETQQYAVILSCSENKGKTWYRASTVADNGYNRFCEGALVILEGGELACVMRESHGAGFPSYVAFSNDTGNTWSAPRMLPFSFHRPYAKQLPDGRVLVTGRNIGGGLGTYAWCGDLKAESGQYQVGGPRRKYSAELASEALVIDNKPGHECRYSLHPIESCRSEVLFEAEVKVDGPSNVPVACMSIGKLRTKSGPSFLYIGSDSIAFSRSSIDFKKRVDMTGFRKITLCHSKGLLQVKVDGETLIHSAVFHEESYVVDFYGKHPEHWVMFGQFGDEGQSCWKSVRIHVKNRSQPDYSWSWEAKDGLWPDEYKRKRLIQIHPNRPEQEPGPDNGYSSWVLLPDGNIMFVDYTNLGDEPYKSHLVGAYIDPEDIH